MNGFDLQARRLIADYLAGKTSLPDLRRWFVEQAWDVERRSDHETAAVVHEVELLLAEFEHGDWTTDEIADRFRPLVTQYSFTIGSPVMTTSGSNVSRFQVPHRPPAASGIRFVTEFA